MFFSFYWHEQLSLSVGSVPLHYRRLSTSLQSVKSLPVWAWPWGGSIFSEVCRSLSTAALAGVAAAAALALCVTMLPGVLAVLLTLFSLAESKDKDFYTFKVVNSRGKLVSLEKYRGSVSPGVIVRVGDLCMSVGCMNECCMFYSLLLFIISSVDVITHSDCGL